METVNFKDLDIKRAPAQIPVEGFEGVKVDNFLSFDEKVNLIEITVQEADEGDIINPILLDKYFDLNIIYMYSNILFTEEEKQDDSKLYDIVTSSGLLDAIMQAIPGSEIVFLNDMLDQYVAKIEKYKQSALGGLKAIINSISEKNEVIADFLNNTDKNKLDEIADFANKIQK